MNLKNPSRGGSSKILKNRSYQQSEVANQKYLALDLCSIALAWSNHYSIGHVRTLVRPRRLRGMPPTRFEKVELKRLQSQAISPTEPTAFSVLSAYFAAKCRLFSTFCSKKLTALVEGKANVQLLNNSRGGTFFEC